MPVTAAKTRAPRLEMRPRTRGRLRVRDIRASEAGSRYMFRVLAEAEQRAVPVVRKRRVRAEREGEVVVSGRRSGGTG